MVGQILGLPGTLPPVFRQIEIKTHLLPRLLGVAADENRKKDAKVERDSHPKKERRAHLQMEERKLRKEGRKDPHKKERRRKQII